MQKKKQTYICASCGGESGKWSGKCNRCGEWNSIVEAEKDQPLKNRSATAIPLSEISQADTDRLMTGLGEFDLVCGGGLVPGSVILIGGEPGIGKSTLALQIACTHRTLYISGEESPVQIRSRSERLGINGEQILVSTNTRVDDIIALIELKSPAYVIIDSIQTIASPEAPGLIGSVSQVKESTARLVECAKQCATPLLLIGHITKDGSIAGPKVLEHIVDTVLYFEGDFALDYRLLRSFKNRYGSVNEIGMFQMTTKGLIEVRDKNSVFINPYESPAPGSAITAAIEGTRTILFEVQSLVTGTSFANPRRMSDGFDLNRLILLIAVLEKHASLKLSDFDVFLNIAGGYRITETAADLAVAMTIASSLQNKQIDHKTAFLAEISLSGELRPVPQCNQRINELIRAGFKTIIISKCDAQELKKPDFDGEIIGIGKISAAIKYLF